MKPFMLRHIPRLIAALAFGIASAHAQDAWPTRTVQIVVPFPAGGLIDVVARAIADHMRETLGKSVVVVNRDGGGGSIGVNAVATATPDGHTLGLVTSAALTVLPLARKGIPYSLESVRSLCQVGGVPLVLAVAPQAQARIGSLAGFIAAARAAPGKLNVGFVGEGTLTHLALADFAAKAGIQLTLVPYRGDPPMALALRGGEIDAAILTLGMTVSQNFAAAVSFSAQRHPDLPQTPTAAENGIDVVVEPAIAMIAPGGLPDTIQRAAEKACLAALKSPRVEQALKTGRLHTVSAGSQGLDTVLRNEARLSEVMLRRLDLMQK